LVLVGQQEQLVALRSIFEAYAAGVAGVGGGDDALRAVLGEGLVGEGEERGELGGRQGDELEVMHGGVRWWRAGIVVVAQRAGSPLSDLEFAWLAPCNPSTWSL
jgi:hypothetical protein